MFFPSTFIALISFRGYDRPLNSPLSVRISQQPTFPFALPLVPHTIAIDSLPFTVATDLPEVAIATELSPVLSAIENSPMFADIEKSPLFSDTDLKRYCTHLYFVL